MSGPDEMLERVARALCDDNWDARDFTETANGDEPEEQRDYWRGKARDAIEAMSEPTEAMLIKGCCIPGVSLETGKRMWQAMIDAALSANKEA